MSQSTATARVLTRPVVRPTSKPRPPQPRLRVVAPRTRQPTTWLALLCVVLLGAGLLGLLLLNISVGKGAYALTELQQEQLQLAEQRQSLAQQVEDVSAPQHLAISAHKLGMVPAPNTAFVRLPDGTVHGTPAVAKPAAKPSHKQPNPKPSPKSTP